MRRQKKVLRFLLSALILKAAFAQPVEKKGESPVVLAYRKFGFNLLSEAIKQDRGRNIFISPLSVAIALAMTYNGAKGETKEAMAKVLGLEGMELAEVNRAHLLLRENLKTIDPNLELLIANSIWARKGVRFKPDFLERNKQSFGAHIASLDFTKPSTPKIINQWVDRNTKGKIKKIVERIEPLTVMFLINAIYFKGNWRFAFDEKRTEKGTFHLLAGKEKEVMMMAQSGRFPYYKGEGFQSLSLPYGQGRVSMYIFLPDKDIGDFLNKLNHKTYGDWVSQFQEREGFLKLPRFKLEYEKSLVAILKALGMGVAFNPDEADFTGMREERDLFISDVKHKAVCEVNEKGTEAAAVTSVEISLTAIREPEERFTFIADRPFFFTIHDNQTGAVLFTGVVVEPN